MKLTNEQYEALYDEMKNINEENVEGEFYVSSPKESKGQAIQFLMDECDY
ncbi:hypothetical protein HA071_26460, partial [Escherichia coli]|nr:hypothetical protein [Escherichia coli]